MLERHEFDRLERYINKKLCYFTKCLSSKAYIFPDTQCSVLILAYIGLDFKKGKGGDRETWHTENIWIWTKITNTIIDQLSVMNMLQ